MRRNGLTYADTGVDIAAGDALVRRIAPAAQATARPGVMGGLGGFGALFDLAAAGFRDPILVAATDGVGTKLKVAIEAGQVGGLGQDLVAMCVNDLVCQGAEPLFFLDYLATGRLDVEEAATVVEGIAAACAAVGCALIGGETAEMPGLYAPATSTSPASRSARSSATRSCRSQAREGDVLIGLGSVGTSRERLLDGAPHRPRARGSTGARPRRSAAAASPTRVLAPTRLYVAAVRQALATGGLRAAAHITGGGLTGNLPRVLPDGLGAAIDLGAWRRPPVFGWLRDTGGVSDDEMLRTFNCGIGMVLVVAPEAVYAHLAALAGAGEEAAEIGRVVPGSGVSYSGAW